MGEYIVSAVGGFVEEKRFPHAAAVVAVCVGGVSLTRRRTQKKYFSYKKRIIMHRTNKRHKNPRGNTREFA